MESHKLKLSEFPCCVERAKSARSQCHGCKQNINKGYLRFGQQYNMDHNGNLWYHTWCFRNFPKEPITAAQFFFGYERLDPSGKKKIDTLLDKKYKNTKSFTEKQNDDDVEEEDNGEDEEGDGDDDEEEEDIWEDEDENEDEEGDAEEEIKVATKLPLQPFQFVKEKSSSPIKTPTKTPVKREITQKSKQYSPFSAQSVNNIHELNTVLPLLIKLGKITVEKGDWLQYMAPPTCRPYVEAALEVYSITNDLDDLADTLVRVR